MKTRALLMLPLAMAAILSLNSCVLQRQSCEDYLNTAAAVKLDQANYRVLATQVRGESKGLHLFGIIPLHRASKLDAVENLYNKCGDLKNRPTALVNVRKEASGTNYVLFTVPKVQVSADVIEFIR